MFAASTAGKGQRQAAEPSYYYEDNGCEVAATCLQCPLPRCKHDDMEWYIRHRRLASDLRMATIIREEGLSIAEAAERFAITTRTVFRVLRRCRNAMRELSPAEIEVFVALPARRQHSGA